MVGLMVMMMVALAAFVLFRIMPMATFVGVLIHKAPCYMDLIEVFFNFENFDIFNACELIDKRNHLVLVGKQLNLVGKLTVRSTVLMFFHVILHLFFIFFG